jgi:hypothetical protein
MKVSSQRITVLFLVIAFSLLSGPALAGDLEWSRQNSTNHALAADKINLEDNRGYSSEYIFGMTKGVMNSTLEPALKPVALVLTVPLDIAFLPFAAIGGFFR